MLVIRYCMRIYDIRVVDIFTTARLCSLCNNRRTYTYIYLIICTERQQMRNNIQCVSQIWSEISSTLCM